MMRRDLFIRAPRLPAASMRIEVVEANPSIRLKRIGAYGHTTYGHCIYGAQPGVYDLDKYNECTYDSEA